MTTSSSSATTTGEKIALATNLLNATMLAMDSGNAARFQSCFTSSSSSSNNVPLLPPRVHIRLSGAVKNGDEQVGSLAPFIKEKFPKSQHWEGNVFVTNLFSCKKEESEKKTEGEGELLLNSAAEPFPPEALKYIEDNKSVLDQLSSSSSSSKVKLLVNRSYWKALSTEDGSMISCGEHFDLITLVGAAEAVEAKLAFRLITHSYTKATGHVETKQ